MILFTILKLGSKLVSTTLIIDHNPFPRRSLITVVLTFNGPSFRVVVSATLLTNVPTRSTKSIQGQQQQQHQGQTANNKSDRCTVRAPVQAPVLNPQLRDAVFSVVQR